MRNPAREEKRGGKDFGSSRRTKICWEVALWLACQFDLHPKSDELLRWQCAGGKGSGLCPAMSGGGAAEGWDIEGPRWMGGTLRKRPDQQAEKQPVL